jgi:ribonuclease HIII
LGYRAETFSRKRVRIYRTTKTLDWTLRTARISRQAHKCTKLHNRRIEQPRFPILDQAFCQIPENPPAGSCFDICLQIDQPGEHPGNIPVENRCGPIESKTGYCPGGVPSNTGKPHEIRDGLRQPRDTTLHQLPGAAVQISRPIVIPQALPSPKNFLFAGRSERYQCRELIEPAPVIVEDRCYLRLLEHELGNKDPVRIAGFAPGQLASLSQIPRDKQGAKLRDFQSDLSHAQRVNSYSSALTPEQAEKLRALLLEQNFEFSERPYMIFFAQKGKLSIAVFEKGPKVVIQGKEAEDFIRFQFEPVVTGEARLGYEEVLQPQMFEPHFGVDESGKGDFFGPLVIAGAYVDRAIARRLLDGGVMDSKRIGSDQRIKVLAECIRQIPGLAHNVVLIGPERYNELYARLGNLNDLLGWGHARVIENLLKDRPNCPRSLSDKFANERVILRALIDAGRRIQIEQRTKAEADVAVAAASILAREKFILWLENKGKQFGVILPKGVSTKVKTAAQELVKIHGAEFLPKVAKMHFRTSAEVLERNSQ